MNYRVCRISAATAVVLVLALGECRGVSIRKARRDPGAERIGAPTLSSISGALDGVAKAAATLAALPPGPDRRRDEAIGRHNTALGRFLRLTGGRRPRLDRAWRDALASAGIRISVRRDGVVWDPDQFDEFLFPRDFEVGGLDHPQQSPGLGVPLIAIRRFPVLELARRPGADRFLMPRQIESATAVLRPIAHREGGVEFRLELHDPLRFRGLEYAGHPEPLAADLTTPLVYQLARSPLPILQEIGLLEPQWLEALEGLYLLHPYQPGKIPVVLVHGLRSSPLAWLKVINDLRGDPAIRDRFQFWLFMYPTGSPFPDSAARLRAALDDLRGVIDPRKLDPALDRMVLVGHSMGGLVSKLMILASGDALWRLVATRPFEEIRTTPERREELRRVFFFEPHPSVRRVVFIATPHHGSALGDEFIGRLTDFLIRLPSRLLATYKDLLAENGPDFFTPEFRSGLPSSIDELRRDNPLLETLARLPIGPSTPYHSIIGRKDPMLPLDRCSDGVVPYRSAHLDGAASECLVRGDHGCQDGPETIAELRRILAIHLEQADRETRGMRAAGRDSSVSRRSGPRRESCPDLPAGRASRVAGGLAIPRPR